MERSEESHGNATSTRSFACSAVQECTGSAAQDDTIPPCHSEERLSDEESHGIPIKNHCHSEASASVAEESHGNPTSTRSFACSAAQDDNMGCKVTQNTNIPPCHSEASAEESHGTPRKRAAFSLIELLISLIAISCIIAAFAPVITKKVMSGGSSSFASLSQDCESFGSDCSLCTKSKCFACNKDEACGEGKYLNKDKCACEACPEGSYCENNKKYACSSLGNKFYCDGITKASCPPEHYCEGGKKDKCSNLSYEWYCKNGVKEKCPDNNYCEKGVANPCSSINDGSYCKSIGSNKYKKEDCPNGYYCVNNQQIPCKGSQIGDGFKCGEGDDKGKRVQCSGNYYCINGEEKTCTSLEQKYYCNGDGYRHICEEGSYCNNGKQEDCGLDNYCINGQRTSCATLDYTSYCTDNHTKRDCPDNYYCIEGKAEACSNIPNGSICEAVGGNKYKKGDCPTNYYCEGNEQHSCYGDTMPAGWTCIGAPSGTRIQCGSNNDYCKNGYQYDCNTQNTDGFKCQNGEQVACATPYYCEGGVPNLCSGLTSAYYCNNGKKESCPAYQQCSGGANNTCPSGSYCTGGSAYTCTTGYYCSGGARYSCPTHCYSCTSSTYCNSCNTGYSGTTCTSCSTGYYKSGSTCYKCNSSCYTCSGSGSNNCTGCYSGYYKSGSSCYSCSDTNCSSCPSNVCSSCKSGYHMFNSKCVANVTPASLTYSSRKIMKQNIGDASGTGSSWLQSIGITVVATVSGNATANTSNTTPTCWVATTYNSAADGCTATSNGVTYSYNPCKRTVCNWYAANIACAALGTSANSWRLPTSTELQSWRTTAGSNSALVSALTGTSGLQLCDNSSASYSAPLCSSDLKCTGSYDGYCGVAHVWSVVSSSSSGYRFCLTGGAWTGPNNNAFNIARSVRCVQ